MYVYDQSVNSILKAGFLYAHTGEFPLYEGEAGNSLFTSSHIPVNDISWEHIFSLNRYFQGKKQEISQDKILSIIFYNLRHKEIDRHNLIVEGIKELTSMSANSWLTGATNTSRTILHRKSDVSREIHKMVGYIRFVPIEENFLVGTAPLEHSTADLVLIRFRQRYPKHKLGLVVGKDACILDAQDNFHIEDGTPYLKKLQEDQFKEVWKEYYTSQYIEQRKNITYVQKSIPKKYWHWLDEGSIIAEEARKK